MTTADLIKRLEDGEGKDWELERDVVRYLWPNSVMLYRVLESLDACIALAEKVLPGFYVGIDGTQSWLVTIYHGGHEGTGEHKNFPRAFLLALLKTKGREKP